MKNQFCTFILSDLFLGIEAIKVQEIIRHQKIVPVPLAESYIRGLINLRGQLVTAIDLAKRLQLNTNRDSNEDGMNIVLSTPNGNGLVSFIVDQIGDVLEVSDEFFEPPPEVITDSVRTLLKGVYKLKNRLLLVLDVDKIIHTQIKELKEP